MTAVAERAEVIGAEDLPESWQPQPDALGRRTDPDGPRTYEYPPTGELLDSVTSVISGTSGKPWLQDWAAKLAAEEILSNLGTYVDLIVRDGYDAAVEVAKGAAERRRGVAREVGIHVHDIKESLLLWAASPDRTGADIVLPEMPSRLEGARYDMGGGEFLPVPEVADAMVTGFLNFCSDFSPAWLATEMPVYNQPLGIAGTLDSIFELAGYGISGDGRRVVPRKGGLLAVCEDTKSGKNPEAGWKEQMSGYRRMPECGIKLGGVVSEVRPMPPTTCGAVLHLRPAYPGGYLLMLVASSDDEAAWQRFKRAATIYRERKAVRDKPGRVIRALRADGTMPGPRLCDMFSEGYGRALRPLSDHFGNATELELIAELTRKELLGIKGIGPKLADAVTQMLADQALLAAAAQEVA